MVSNALDQTALIADPFYELREPLGRDKVSNAPILKPGQLVRAHLSVPSSKLQVLELDNFDPKDEKKATFKIANVSTSGAPTSHFPIKELALRRNLMKPKQA